MAFTILSTYTIIDGTETTRLEQRVESRCALRGAFTDIYDYLDEQAAKAGKPVSQFTQDLRIRLNEKYKPIIPDKECPK